MYKGKKVIVVLPAYNAALTLEKTYQEIPMNLVDEVILCDDASRDNTVELIIIMLHPDYQYTPKLIPTMVNIIGEELYPVVLGSRILGKGALEGGMPVYKYIANRFLTFSQNLLVSYKLSEYHTGYRAFSREVLETINFNANSDDFVFDKVRHGCVAGIVESPSGKDGAG